MNIVQAVRARDLDEVNRLLLNPRLNIDQIDKGETALTSAISSGQDELAQRLIEYGANVNLAATLGLTPLMLAVQGWNTDVVRLLLEQDGINVNAINDAGRTVLLDACLIVPRVGHRRPRILEIIEMLLGSGADANFMSNRRSTALGIAVANNDIELSRLLVDHGADVNQKRLNGSTYLGRAAYGRKSDILSYLLTVPNIDIDDVEDNGQTALMLAAQSNPVYSRRVVAMLLEAGADPLVKSNDGRTARQYIVIVNPEDAVPTNFNRLNAQIEVSEMIEQAENIWRAEETRANQDLTKKFIVSRRLREGTDTPVQLPQRQLPDYIIRRAEYDNLCLGLHNNLNKPGVVALARSLKIPISNLTKRQLCNAIAAMLIK